MISRYEIKFRINHAQKERFLDAARFGLQEDPYGHHACYRVSSVYFDSRNLDFFWEKVDGVALRRKLRLRYYGEVENAEEVFRSGCYLELKHRIKDSVHKERVRLTPDGARLILDDARNLRDLRSLVVDEDRRTANVIESLERIEAGRDFQAANVISYLREAWLGSVDGRLRVTFDQLAHAYNPECFDQAGSRLGLPIIPAGHYVMEVKFNEVFPRWIRDILAKQNLLPRRFSKYAAGIETLRNLDLRCKSSRWALESGMGICPQEGEFAKAAENAELHSPPAPLPQMDTALPELNQHGNV